MVRVIIERKLKADKESEMWALTHELRSKGMRQPGYVSGETLVGYDDPSLWVVISTWLTAELWQAWANNPERQAIAARVAPLLTAPARTTVLKFLEEPEARK